MDIWYVFFEYCKRYFQKTEKEIEMNIAIVQTKYEIIELEKEMILLLHKIEKIKFDISDIAQNNIHRELTTNEYQQIEQVKEKIKQIRSKFWK